MTELQLNASINLYDGADLEQNYVAGVHVSTRGARPDGTPRPHEVVIQLKNHCEFPGSVVLEHYDNKLRALIYLDDVDEVQHIIELVSDVRSSRAGFAGCQPKKEGP